VFFFWRILPIFESNKARGKDWLQLSRQEIKPNQADGVFFPGISRAIASSLSVTLKEWLSEEASGIFTRATTYP
jgi:hypothetical protein